MGAMFMLTLSDTLNNAGLGVIVLPDAVLGDATAVG